MSVNVNLCVWIDQRYIDSLTETVELLYFAFSFLKGFLFEHKGWLSPKEQNSVVFQRSK